METIHQIIVESVSGGFWNFIGYWIMISLLLGIPAKVLIFAINRPLRHRTIRKQEYLPSHCDADGDFKDGSEQLFAFLKYHYKGSLMNPTDEELKKYIEIYLSK